MSVSFSPYAVMLLQYFLSVIACLAAVIWFTHNTKRAALRGRHDLYWFDATHLNTHLAVIVTIGATIPIINLFLALFCLALLGIKWYHKKKGIPSWLNLP